MAPQKNPGFIRWLALAGRVTVMSWIVAGCAAPSFAVVADTAEAPASEDGRRPGPVEAGERMDALHAEIAYHDELYFKRSAPVISDFSYDQLKRELAALERAFPGVAQERAMLAGVGDDRSGLFPTCRHRVRMLSLNKCYTEPELRAFDARLMRQLDRRDLDYVVEPKFDGLAVSVTFEKGKLIRAVTRGDGEEGDDITANAGTIRSLPRALRAATPDGAANPVPDLIELRGEIFISYPEFARINRERESAGETPFAHPRNLAAGTLKQLDARETARRRLEVVFYGLGACEPAGVRPDSQRALLRQLRAWGLPTVEAPRMARGVDAMWQAVQALGRERAGYDFPTDGAVVKLDAVVLQDRVGVTKQAPLWAVAYKFALARVETQVRAITLQVGRTGLITPVAELVPVRIGGSTVARATLYNRDEIARRDIRVGDFVLVEKAGEIIPAIAGVNRARRTDGVKPYVFPDYCPVCRTKLTQLSGETAVRCPNGECPAQVRRRIEFFASAAGVGISGLGPALVQKLVENGLVRNVADLYRLQRDDLLAAGAGGEKSVDRLLEAIESSKRAELGRFVHGLGIPGVGEVASRDLARRFGGLDALAQARREDFIAAGQPVAARVGEAAAKAVLAHFAQPENQAVVAKLLASGVRPVAPAADPATRQPLVGKTFVLTGALPNLTRVQAAERIVAAGGSVASTVNRSTSFVVAGEGAGEKLQAGQALGVAVIDEAELLRMLEPENG
jgi:DNA ligase (NAD+)